MGTFARNKDRPKYLDLRRIRLPITGIVSILHRISGVLLILAIPLGVYLLQLSLRNEQGFQQAAELLSAPIILLFIILLSWAIAHHFFAGLRHLLFDVDIGVTRESASVLAKCVLIAEGVSFLLILGWLL